MPVAEKHAAVQESLTGLRHCPHVALQRVNGGFYVWLVQVPPGRRTTVGHAVRRTSPLLGTLATAATEMKCSLTRN